VRGLFVTGTDTGVGKTILSAALLAAMAAAGERVSAHKPAVTGLDDRSDTGWPPDHELLANVAGMTPEEVAPLRYGPAVSPHLRRADCMCTRGGDRRQHTDRRGSWRSAGPADR